MKKKIVFTSLLLGGVLIITSSVYRTESNGAPIASTNAPGELTCNRSSCHTGSALNSGSGFLEIDFGKGGGPFMSDSIYDITISMAQAGIERFGFQALILRDEDTSNVGEFIVVDSLRTKVVKGINQYKGRKYITYNYPGTHPVAPGLGQWHFKWKAPANDSGSVTLYVAAAAANNDATDHGDLIYTRQRTITSLHAGLNSEENSGHMFLSVLPNPASGSLQIIYHVKQEGNTTIYLIDMHASSVELLHREDAPGVHHVQFDLNQEYASGMYFVTISNGLSSETRKLLIN